MAEVTLNVSKREGTGKGVARRIRAAGKVPAVVYGRGMDPVSIEVDRREFVHALTTDAGTNVLLSLELDGEKITTLARELQRDPVKGTLLHADFVKVDLKVEIEVEVPLHLVGEALGVKEGGVLEHPLFTVHVRCLPTDVPESIELDISNMNIGDSMRVSDLSAGREFQIINDPDTVVAHIAAPISEEELAAMEAAVEGEAPEEEAAEAAEVAEGEEGEAGPAEGEAAEQPEAAAPEGEGS
jgi:large subunit ribosomal protein L25